MLHIYNSFIYLFSKSFNARKIGMKTTMMSNVGTGNGEAFWD